MKPDRVEAFSDGIFAILITILVLEFNIPNYRVGHLLKAVEGQWPILFSYVITYTYIGILWLFHHDLFHTLKKTNVGLNIINLVSLFLITLLNYATLMVSETITKRNIVDMRFAFCVYDAVAFLISGSYLVFYLYLGKHVQLLKNEHANNYNDIILRYPFTSMILYLLSFVLNFFQVYIGLSFLILGILFHGIAYLKTAKVHKNTFFKILSNIKKN